MTSAREGVAPSDCSGIEQPYPKSERDRGRGEGHVGVANLYIATTTDTIQWQFGEREGNKEAHTPFNYI